MEQILLALSSGVLGVFLGAQLCEAVLLVPYWKRLQPKTFFELHKSFGHKIYRFFAPLTITATMIPIGTMLFIVFKNSEVNPAVIIMGICVLLFFSTYFIFFKKANQSFAEASISFEDLPDALNRWEKWHWGRIILQVIALICALLAML